MDAATTDPFDLQRFVTAQHETYAMAIGELRAGSKRGHWIWYVLPQLRGLGQSAMSWRYGIVSVEEARAYLAHPVLGPRIRECAMAIATSTARSANAYFGWPDDRKVRSCMTLFLRADPGEAVFKAVLDRYYDGLPDPATDQMLGTNG